MNKTNNSINVEKWIINYYPYLQNYTMSRVSNQLDVEEIISDTFFAALKAKNNFQNKCSERTWLTAILRHKIIDYYRKQASQKSKLHRHAISHEEYQEKYFYETAVTRCEESTLADLNVKALEQALAESLNNIPESQSKVAKLRIYEELSTEEICTRLEISKNNAWVLMSRARKSLAMQLKAYDYAV